MIRIDSLHFKVVAAIIGPAILVALIFSGILYPFEVGRYEAQIERTRILLDTVYQQKLEDLANELFARNQRALAATMEEILSVAGIVGVRVHLPDGKLFIEQGQVIEQPLPLEKLRSLRQQALFIRSVDDRPLGLYSRSLDVIGHEIGFVSIYYDFSPLQRETKQLAASFIILLLTTILFLSLLLTWLLRRLVINPVELLREAIQQVQEGHLGQTVELSTQDEIGLVGRAFNEMSGDLAESQIALRAAEEKYRGIFENAVEGIFQLDPDTRGILTANPSMVQLLGYQSEAQLIEQAGDFRAQLCVAPEEWDRLEMTLRWKESVLGYEIELFRSDRSRIWVSISARNVKDEEGQLCQFEGSLIDVTQQREREQAERGRKAAEAANQAKSEFLANMSHEIRTPMNAILGFADLLVPEMESPRQQEFLAGIRSSGRSLLGLIDEILDLAKIEAGKMELHYQPVSLRALFDDLRRIFQADITAKKLVFYEQVAEEIPDSLLLDELRLRQVLFNLIGNAVKFTERGSIRLAAELANRVDPSVFELRIQVEDTGPGIPLAAQEQIFDAFCRQETVPNLGPKGSGLGLTITRKLVGLMGGQIRLVSTEKQGSTFEIILPDVKEAVMQEPINKEKSDAEAIVFPRGKLLVVDDLEVNRKLVQEFLRDTTLDVIEAKSGPDALEIIPLAKPDLILLDIRMPGMDGYQTLDGLRALPTGDRLPVIAVTATGMLNEVEHIISCGFDGFLLRPFNRWQLSEKLCQFLPCSDTDRKVPEQPAEPTFDEWSELSAEQHQQLPEICNRLDRDLHQLWQVARQKQRMPDIENFARSLNALGQDANLPQLYEFGGQLLQYAASFDVDRIKMMLETYPKLVEQLNMVKDTEVKDG